MIDAKLAELTASIPQDSKQENSSDVLAKLNERNRRLNQEQVRKAERAELEEVEQALQLVRFRGDQAVVEIEVELFQRRIVAGLTNGAVKG